MILAKLLLIAALALPPPWYQPGTNPENPDQYKVRVVLITRVVAKATEYRQPWPGGPYSRAPQGWPWGRKVLAAVVLAHLYEESRFALEVHQGTKHPVWTQDVGMARCLGQLQVTGIVPEREWKLLAGTDEVATLRCVESTIRVLATMQRYCVPRGQGVTDKGVIRMFSALRGKGCSPTKDGRAKHVIFAKIWNRIR